MKFTGTDGWISETGVTSYRVFFTTCLASFPPKKKPICVRTLPTCQAKSDRLLSSLYIISLFGAECPLKTPGRAPRWELPEPRAGSSCTTTPPQSPAACLHPYLTLISGGVGGNLPESPPQGSVCVCWGHRQAECESHGHIQQENTAGSHSSRSSICSGRPRYVA